MTAGKSRKKGIWSEKSEDLEIAAASQRRT